MGDSIPTSDDVRLQQRQDQPGVERHMSPVA
jgi:hypothetical protein